MNTLARPVDKNTQDFFQFVEEAYRRREQRLHIDYFVIPYLLLRSERTQTELQIMLDHRTRGTIHQTVMKLLEDGYVFSRKESNPESKRKPFYYFPTDKLKSMKFFRDKALFDKVVKVYKYIKFNNVTKINTFDLITVYAFLMIYHQGTATRDTLPKIMGSEDYWLRCIKKLRQMKLVKAYISNSDMGYGYFLSHEGLKLLEG